MISINLNDITILNINGADYCCIFKGISKIAEKKLQNADLTKKRGILKDIDRIVVPNMALFGKKRFKYFIGYEDDSQKIMFLCIMLPKVNAYRRN